MTAGALSQVGAGLWSGDLLGLDLPENPADPTYDGNSDPTSVTGSFISLSHAVTKTNALTCLDCHSSSGVMDFRALSYAPAKVQRLTTLFSQPQFFSAVQQTAGLRLRWSAVPGKRYQLHTTDNMATGTWTPLGTINTAVAPWQEFVVPANQLQSASHLFFRVNEQP